MQYQLTDQELLTIFRGQVNALNYDTCFDKGVEAAKGDKPESANPFKTGTKAHQYWADGWWDGFYQLPANQPKASPSSVKKWVKALSAAVAVGFAVVGVMELAA